jgi:acylphosphatase
MGAARLRQLHAIIHGHVQGVSFRYNTVQQAMRLGLVGWVCNLPDGTVETTAVGKQEVLDAFLAWLQHGPSGARVSKVDADWNDTSNSYNNFEIR